MSIKHSLLLISLILFGICFLSVTPSRNVLIHRNVVKPFVNDSLIYQIFKSKCNVCHLKKKKVIFSIDNLYSYRELINQQVLIKKKMPKGKDFQLTQDEFRLIEDWININP